MTMTEVDRIADELARAHSGDPWHGSSTHAVLAGVIAAEASARPIPNAHTIWELVLHLSGWRREVVRRLRGGKPGMPERGDWPAMPAAADEPEWRRTLEGYDASHRELAAALTSVPPDRLDELVGGDRAPELGTGISWYVMLHGVAQHEAYHTGQIALLRKLTRT
jgi:uncharacterized damage-inducible protein DinB